MSWAWDAPSGTYKDHALSSRIRIQAAAMSVFARWATQEPNYGRNRGQSITVTRIGQMANAGRVSELDDLPTDRPVISTKTVTVSEWGQKTELTSFEEDLTHYELRPRIRQVYRDQMRLTIDAMVAEAMKLTPIKAIGTSAGAVTFDTDGTPSSPATNNLTVAHLRDIRDYLSGTLKVPPFANGMYAGVLVTKAARGIKNDPEYKDWNAPTDPGTFRTSRLKDVENFALFETNHFEALDNTIGSGGVAGEALFFGQDSCFLAEVEEPELRVGLTRDLGRKHEIGWVGTMEAGIPWDEADKARIVHFASA